MVSFYNVGIIGYGYWGPVLLRNFHDHPKLCVKAVCDRNVEKLKLVREKYPECKIHQDYRKILQNPSIDIVVIVTQAAFHYEITKESLLCAKHVFVEKPFTLSLAEAEELITLSRKQNVRIMVDHTFLFTSQYQAVKGVINSGELGRIVHYHATRADFGLFQRDANVLWHLLYHDLYMLLDLFDGYTIQSIKADGATHLVNSVEDSAIVSLTFDEGLTADFVVSLLFPKKERKVIVAGDERLLCWDDTKDEKVQIFHKSAVWNEQSKHVQYDVSDQVDNVVLDDKEALQLEVECLVKGLDSGKPFINDGEAALKVMTILTSIESAMRTEGLYAR